MIGTSLYDRHICSMESYHRTLHQHHDQKEWLRLISLMIESVFGSVIHLVPAMPEKYARRGFRSDLWVRAPHDVEYLIVSQNVRIVAFSEVEHCL